MKIQQIRDNILQECGNSTDNDIHLFNAAFEQAKMALEGKTRENGDPFLCHAGNENKRFEELITRVIARL